MQPFRRQPVEPMPERGLPARLLARLAGSVGAAPRVESAPQLPIDFAATLADYEASGQAWFWQTGIDGRLGYLTPRLADELGLDQEELGSTALTALMFDKAPADEAACGEQTLAFHLAARSPFTGITVRSARQDSAWWTLAGRPIVDERGDFAGFRGSGTPISPERGVDAEIKRLAHYDALTGLPNRLLMRNTLRDALAPAARLNGDCGLFMLDLDRFKSVNDTLGHPVGDVLLQQVAKRLVHIVGSAGRVCRLGGDEFTVIVPNVRDRAPLAQLADAIIARLSFPYTIDGSTISIGASLGIAISPFDGDCPDELVRNADLALYAAKDGGKGIHAFYRPQMHAEARDRRLLELDLREALAKGELDVLYQPVLNTASGRVSAFEALVRWNHPERGTIGPSVFVPIAEEIGLIGTIGEWVLRTAMDCAAAWPDHIRIAVNISPLQFANTSLPAIVANALSSAGLAPDRLELELTEGVFLTESSSVDMVFAALKKLGVRLSLDDFGIGYASLANLKRLPFDSVKVDQSFVRGLSSDGGPDVRFIRAIVELADSLGMTTTAEGAESAAEVDLIRTLGCSQVQGYIFGKPMAAHEALARLEREAVAQVATEREPRVAVFRRGTLTSEGRRYPVRVRNVSTGGVMVEIDRDARISNAIEIELSPQDRFEGSVRWVNGQRLGVSFTVPVDVTRFVRHDA